MRPERELPAPRPACAADHAAFVRLFPELGVDDPILELGRFAEELVPTTLVMEVGTGPEPRHIVGYAFFQIVKEVAHVRHLVTAPEARRSGIGRALMEAVASRARGAGCTTWCLNVKPDNTAALRLYGALGLKAAHRAHAMKIAWAIVDGAQLVVEGVLARPIEPRDDARVETATDLLAGQLAAARALGGRVLVALHEDQHGAGERAAEPGSSIVGAAVFDPRFPGANPFRVARPELALVLLRALRSYADASHDAVRLVVEGRTDVAEALIAAGATRLLDILHMKGPLPAG